MRGDNEARDEAIRRLTATVEQQAVQIADLSRSAQGHGDWLADLQRWMTSTVETVSSMSTLAPTFSAGLARAPAQLADPLERLARQLQIWAVTTWLSQLHPSGGPQVSVVMPTRNRRRFLERAVASVAAQTYPNWELLIIDNASEDDTADFLRTLHDPRIRTLVAPGGLAAAARNIGLAAVAGDFVAYLDDDNLMHPEWLKGVAWAFGRWSDMDFLYGARIFEDPHTKPTVGGAFPAIDFVPFDRARLEVANFIDTGVMAHRAGLPEAHFDEELRHADDWDFALRVTGRRQVLELPLVACSYMVDAPNRMSDSGRYQDHLNRIRARVHTTRQLRIFALAQKVPEKVAGQARRLRELGVRVDLAGRLDGALDTADGIPPDAVLLDPGDADRESLEALERLRLPFVVLVDRPGQPVSQDLEDHRSFLGVWPDVAPNGSQQPFLDELSAALTEWRFEHA